MDFFDLLTMVGGLALFLYGMDVMGDGLAKRLPVVNWNRSWKN